MDATQTGDYQTLLVEAIQAKEDAEQRLNQAYYNAVVAENQKQQAKIEFDASLQRVVQLQTAAIEALTD